MSRSLGTLTLDLIAKTAGFEAGMDRAARVADKRTREIERQARERAKAIEVAFDRMATTVGAASGVAAVGLGAMFKNVVGQIDALNDLADAAGSTIGNISAIEDVARRTGTGLGVVETALVKLNQTLASADPNSPAAAALKAIGLRAEELKDLDPAEALRRIAVALSDFADDGSKARLTQVLFSKSLKEVAPLLKDLADKGELNATVTQQQAEAAEQFNKNLFQMRTEAEDLARSLVSNLLPALNEILKTTQEALPKIGNVMPTLNAQINAALGMGDGNNIRERIADVEAMIAKSEAWQKRLPGGILGSMIGLRISGLNDLKAVLETQQRIQQSEGGADFSGPPSSAKPRPTIKFGGTPPKATPQTTIKEDPLGDFLKDVDSRMKPAEDALARFRDIQLDAATAGADLTRAEQAFFDLINSDGWQTMPEPWKDLARAQFEAANAAEIAAKNERRLNELIEQTPTSQLERQRETMLLVAAAFEKGRLNGEQYLEIVAKVLNTPLPDQTGNLEDGFLDLATVANDAAREMADVFGDFFTGTNKNIGDMLRNFLAAIGKMIAQALLLEAIQSGMKSLGIPLKLGNTTQGKDSGDFFASVAKGVNEFWESITGASKATQGLTESAVQTAAKQALEVVGITTKTSAEGTATASLVALTGSAQAAAAALAAMAGGGGGGGGGLMGSLVNAALGSYSLGTGTLGNFAASMNGFEGLDHAGYAAVADFIDPFAKGGVFPEGVKPFAKGGIVNQPTFFKFANGGKLNNGLMGEAGPEAIVPLPDGRSIPVQMKGGGDSSQQVNISIVVNENGDSKESGGKGQAKELARRVKAVVMETLVEQKRPGGMLHS